MTADKRQLAIARAARTEFQIIVDLRRLAIFVSAKDADIEIEARIFEVVRIAPKKRDLLLGRENQSDVIVAFESVQMVSAALIKRDHVRAQSGFVFAFLFDRRDRGFARIGSFLACHVRFNRAVDPRGHLFDRH